MALVYTLERRHGLAFVFVQGGGDDTAVSQLNIRRFDVVLEGERVLHPFLVITLLKTSIRLYATRVTEAYIWEILTSVSATRFLASSSRHDGLHGALENVAKFEGFNEVTA